jgi:hypothetical protein
VKRSVKSSRNINTELDGFVLRPVVPNRDAATQGCRREVLGVPLVITFLGTLDLFLMGAAKYLNNIVRVP